MSVYTSDLQHALDRIDRILQTALMLFPPNKLPSWEIYAKGYELVLRASNVIGNLEPELFDGDPLDISKQAE